MEGWIGFDGLAAASAEFHRHRYRYVVTVGGPTSSRWDTRPWNYADMAASTRQNQVNFSGTVMISDGWR